MILLAGGLASSSSRGEEAAAQKTASVTVTVQPGARQEFFGFGASLCNWGGEYQQIAQTNREALSKLLWHDLNFKIFRLWLNTFQFRPGPGTSDLSQFRKCYVDSGLIADAQKNGVTTLLLAPDGLPEFMIGKRPDGGLALKAGAELSYAILLSDFIKRLKDETGVIIDVTGVQNEPNDNKRFSPQQIVDVVKYLRCELDARGLPGVKIIAPEHASADATLYEQVDALEHDPAAWSALAGVASHSYNMAASDEIAQRIAGPDGRNLKPYWMTEASENGPEEPGDLLRAASLATRFLNDMNHRVTHWVHFIGFEVADPKDNATRIISYKINPPRTDLFAKYYYYRQLSRCFDSGALFRTSHSSLEGSMTWGYGQKPRLTVAAAKNPDGSWGIGLCNFTADSFEKAQGWADAKWNREQGGHTPGQVIQVTLEVPELKAIDALAFSVTHSSEIAQNKSDGQVVLHHGELTLSVQPLELITLRSTLAR